MLTDRFDTLLKQRSLAVGKHLRSAHSGCAGSPDFTINLSRQAQLEPTAESVLDMLLPAVCTFWPWLLACS